MGLRPKFIERLEDLGLHLDREIFEPEPFARTSAGRAAAAMG
jgi:hypothetical protein